MCSLNDILVEYGSGQNSHKKVVRFADGILQKHFVGKASEEERMRLLKQ